MHQTIVAKRFRGEITSDSGTEGIFRKNGNIRHLKEAGDTFELRQPTYLENENEIQIAVLLKKWLRELPDPLLTHKLAPLFIQSQSIFDIYSRAQERN